MINKDRLRTLFVIKNGGLYYKEARGHLKANTKAGYVDEYGYVRIAIDGKKYMEHTLVWIYYFDEVPHEIDHINNIRRDNRIENLREVTKSENQLNVGIKSTNKSGYKNVCWNKLEQKWKVQLRVDGKCKHIGSFDDLQMAAQAAQKARTKYHGEFANHGKQTHGIGVK